MSNKELNLAAMKLPPKRRAMLAEQLLASLDDETQRAIDAEWATEGEARIDAFDAGKIRSKSFAKVLSRLNRRKKR
jgi:putative addiction module component (TIGR02574 family)